MYIISLALDKTSYGAILEYSHRQPKTWDPEKNDEGD